MKRVLLAQHGVCSQAAGQAVRQVIDECVARGATVLDEVTAIHWTRAVTPRQLLTAWEGKPRLDSRAGGDTLDKEARALIVKELQVWASSEFGDLDRQQRYDEEYALEGVRLP
jgi:hypothetical protein